MIVFQQWLGPMTAEYLFKALVCRKLDVLPHGHTLESSPNWDQFTPWTIAGHLLTFSDAVTR